MPVYFKPCTEDRYNEMLNMMPPAVFTSSGFMVGEAWTHRECEINNTVLPAFAAFVRLHGQHYESTGPMTIPEFRAITRADILREDPKRPFVSITGIMNSGNGL